MIMRYFKKLNFYIEKLTTLKADLSEYLIDLQQPFYKIKKLKELLIFQDIEATLDNFEADVVLYFTEFLIFQKNLDLILLTKKIQQKFELKYQNLFEQLHKNPKKFFMNQVDKILERIVIKKQSDYLEEFGSEIYFWVPKDYVCRMYDNEEFIFIKQCITLQRKRLLLFTKLKNLISKSRKILLQNSSKNAHSLQKKINDYIDLKKGLKKQEERVDYWFSKLIDENQQQQFNKKFVLPKKIDEDHFSYFDMSLDVYNWNKKHKNSYEIFKSDGYFNFKVENVIDKNISIKNFVKYLNFKSTIQNIKSYFKVKKQNKSSNQMVRIVRFENFNGEFKEYYGIFRKESKKKLDPFIQNLKYSIMSNYSENTDEELQLISGESLISSQVSVHDSNYQFDDDFLVAEDLKEDLKYNEKNLKVIDFSVIDDEQSKELQQKLTCFKISAYGFPIPVYQDQQSKIKNEKKIQLLKQQIIDLIGLKTKAEIDNLCIKEHKKEQLKKFITKYGVKVYFPKIKIFTQYFKLDSYVKLMNLSWQRKIDYLHRKNQICRQFYELIIIVLFIGQDKKFLIDKQVHVFLKENCQVQIFEVKDFMEKCLIQRYIFRQEILEQYNIKEDEILKQIQNKLKNQLISNNIKKWKKKKQIGNFYLQWQSQNLY